MSFKDEAYKAIVSSLKEDGERILEECYNARDFQNRSYNLRDSYGYCVFVDGKPHTMGFLEGKMAKNGKKWYNEVIEGREAISDFFSNEYKSPSGSIELVVAAAMPYAQVLENGGASDGRFSYRQSYKVISMSYDKLKAILSKYPGANVSRLFEGKSN